jgi:hypothetical protein
MRASTSFTVKRRSQELDIISCTGCHVVYQQLHSSFRNPCILRFLLVAFSKSSSQRSPINRRESNLIEIKNGSQSNYDLQLLLSKVIFFAKFFVTKISQPVCFLVSSLFLFVQSQLHAAQTVITLRSGIFPLNEIVEKYLSDISPINLVPYGRLRISHSSLVSSRSSSSGVPAAIYGRLCRTLAHEGTRHLLCKNIVD